MESSQRKYRVLGMSCVSCERHVEESLGKVPGVESAKADAARGIVNVVFSDSPADEAAIRAAISEAGYEMAKDKAPPSWGGLAIGAVLALAYFAADATGLFSAIPSIQAGIGFSGLFLVGLLTSAHCVAMCGGIVIGVSSKSREGSEGSRLSPAILYNAGRIASYTLTGLIAGATGAAFGLSVMAKAAIMFAAAILMLAFALRNLGVLRLPSLRIPALDAVSGKISGFTKGKSPLIVGLLNGLMPCGPLQSMQIFALGSGGPAEGALAMAAFGLGTVPLMAGLGIFAHSIPKRFVPAAAKASGILVLAFAFVTASRAAALAGFTAEPTPSIGAETESAAPKGSLRVSCCSLDQAGSTEVSSTPGPNVPTKSKDGSIYATVENGVQTVVTPVSPRGYPRFTVKAGIPVRWILRAEASDLNGCNEAIVVPALGIEKALVPGDNLIEFTPKTAGKVAFSCWMGMIRSSFTVE